MASDAVVVKVTREVDPAAVFGGPMRELFDRIMLLARSKAASPGQVPIDTGYLRQTLEPGGGVTEVSGSYESGFVASVGSGLVYGAVLEAGTRKGAVMHYRAGPSAGDETKGWLSRIVPPVVAELPGLIGKFNAAVEAGWNRG